MIRFPAIRTHPKDERLRSCEWNKLVEIQRRVRPGTIGPGDLVICISEIDAQSFKGVDNLQLNRSSLGNGSAIETLVFSVQRRLRGRIIRKVSE